MTQTNDREVTEVTFRKDGKIIAYLNVNIYVDDILDEEMSSKKNKTYDDWVALPQIAKAFVTGKQ